MGPDRRRLGSCWPPKRRKVGRLMQTRKSSLAPLALLSLTLALGACAESGGPLAHDDGAIEGHIASGRVQPLCHEGFCTGDPDPFAGEPGYSLGTAITSVTCFNGSQTDADQDGVSDFCERNIAAAFAPELRHYNLDNIQGEAYWAARKVLPSKVLVAYLPAYYRDHGSPAYGCSLPFAPPSCGGHNGDSEIIGLQVYYDAETRHWVLDRAFLSAHGAVAEYSRGDDAYPSAFAYPAKPGGYPRIWLSEGKHANYSAQFECNLGGFFGADTCERNNTSTRFYFGGDARGLGSRSLHTPAQDCKQSVNPSYIYYGSGRIECFWTNQRFRGWIPASVGGADSDAYSAVLASIGF